MLTTEHGKRCDCGVILLGGINMPANDLDAENLAPDPTLARVLSLLEDALQELDSLGSYPEAGARLQQIIDEVEQQGNVS